jgi:hypothetical protein
MLTHDHVQDVAFFGWFTVIDDIRILHEKNIPRLILVRHGTKCANDTGKT